MEEHTNSVSRKHIILLLVSVGLVLTLVSAVALLQSPPQTPHFSLTAGIIDQLGEEIPNPFFVNTVTTILSNNGFNVTYYNKNLDVAFFKNLGKYNYGLIILRAHAALRDDGSTVDLFTSEPYSDTAHTADQNNGLLVKGVLNYSDVQKEYFAITTKFIENLEGQFPRSIVIAMGCNTLVRDLEQMAEAFHKKGAEAFIGWDGYVGNLHTDEQTVTLLNGLVANNETIGQAVDGTEWDMTYGSRMVCYPETARNLRVSDLSSNTTA
jgi:hypothetical protein